MKTLIVVTHPSIELSVINKRWVEELQKYPDKYTVHELHMAYPDGNIDVETEQRLVELHDNLVFQFPIYWFNCPPLLKKWLDEVLSYGWAYGSKGDKLRNRKVALAVSAGIKQGDYSPTGRYGHTLDQILLPFQLTFYYCAANYRSTFAYYGTENEPGENTPDSEYIIPASNLEKSAQAYIHFIDHL